MYHSILQQAGLNQGEANIYNYLLENGPQPAHKLVEPSGLTRGNVYNTIKLLQTKGLVEERPGTKTMFAALSPEGLRALAKGRLASAQEVINQVEASLPGMQSLFHLVSDQPAVRFFEGFDGMKEAYNDVFVYGGPVHSISGKEKAQPELLDWLAGRYANKRAKEGVEWNRIVSGKADSKGYYADGLKATNSTFVDKKGVSFKGEISAYGSQTMFLAIDKKIMIGFIVDSPGIADTIRSIVKMAQ